MTLPRDESWKAYKDSVPGVPGRDQPLAERLLEFMAQRISPEQRPEDAFACEKSFHTFVRKAWHVCFPQTNFKNEWHVGCVAEHLQALHELQIKKLIICLPPRHGKSVLCCVFWPAWVWSHSPQAQWIFATYGDSLCVRDSVMMRELITSRWYQTRWGGMFQLKAGQDQKTFYTNDRGGHRIATTPRGKGIGHNATHLVGDDLHKPIEIRSEVKRQEVIDFWQKTASTRGVEFHSTRFLICMQRLRENDIAGFLTAEKLGYETLVLPAEYEVGRVIYDFPLPEELPRDAIVPTSLQRERPELRDQRVEEGQILAPQIHDHAAIAALKATLLNDAPAQLQQRPTDAAGSVFQRPYFRYFEVIYHQGEPSVLLQDGDDDPLRKVYPLRACRFFQTIDTASSIKDTAAFTAVLTAAITPGFDLLVWDVWRDRLQVMEIYPALMALRRGPHALHRLTVGRTTFIPSGAQWPVPLLFQAVEDKSSGIGLIQEGAANGTPFERLIADRDCVLRAGPVATLYHNGKVWHKRGSSYLTYFEDELLKFPNGSYADCADTLAYAGIKVVHDKYLRASVGRVMAYAADDRPDGETRQTDDDGSTFRINVGQGGVDVCFDD